MAGALEQGAGLGDAAVDRATAAQCPVELHADLAVAEAAFGGAERGADAGGAEVARVLQRGDRIDGGQARGARALGLEAGDVEREARAAQLRVGVLGQPGPVVDARRRGRRQDGGLGQRPGLHAGTADELVERDAAHAQVVVGLDLARAGEVEAGLRLAGVGDGGRADFEGAAGGRELFGDRAQRGLRGGQRLDGDQHVDVGLRETHGEVLLGQHEVGTGNLERAPGLREAGRAGAVEQRVARAQRAGGDLAVAAAAGGAGGGLLALSVGTLGLQGQRRAQRGGGLGLAVLGGLGLRARGEQGGVVGACGVEQLGQALRLRGRREQGAGGKGRGERGGTQACGQARRHGLRGPVPVRSESATALRSLAAAARRCRTARPRRSRRPRGG